MNKIEKLVQEKCPNGVKKVSLGSLMKRIKEKNYNNSNIQTVYSVTKENGIVESNDLHDFNVYSNDLSNYNVLKINQYAYNPARLNIGSIARLKVDKPGLVSPMYVVFELDSDKISYNYYEHLLFSPKVFNDMCSFVEQGARFRFDYKNWDKIYISLPPLEIQNEIVKILDKFRELQISLEKELDKRKIQYNFWCKKLLKSNNNVIKLKDITSIITKGTTPTSVGFNFEPNGEVNFIKIESLSNGRFNENKLEHISNECNNKLERSKLKENDILFSIAGAIGKTIIVNKKVLPANTNQALAIIRINNSNFNIRYINYYLNSIYIKKQYMDKQKGSAQINVSLNDISNFEIPNISLEEQEKIVNILDKFDKLINDNADGIPAEIEKRRKQYEYYRDKLLSFKEV